jgi:hypothetical protein
MRFALIPLLIFGAAAAVGQPIPSTVHPLHRPLDELLDLYVRDGFVYYQALRLDRGRLDRYVATLNSPAAAALADGSTDERKAFWINAYNALVLKTVVDHLPIRGRASGFPSNSVRQIPGAFEKPLHRVAGRPVSLDSMVMRACFSRSGAAPTAADDCAARPTTAPALIVSLPRRLPRR